MASSIEQFIQYIKEHPGATKRDIATALGFRPAWVNKELYSEAKKPNSNLYKDDSDLPKWYYRTNISEKNNIGTFKFEHDEHTRRVMSLIDSGKNVFVTGKAGTGKTSLLEEIYNVNGQKPINTRKVIAVLAPTGVAAENIKEKTGIDAHTIHSFFKLPITPFAAGYKNEDLYVLNRNAEEVLRELDLIIIDEISMVRCDLLDAVDDVLRHYRKSSKPFGGVQIAMFGDLYQLMPVTKQEEWQKIEDIYETSYFFSSHALSQIDYYYCELVRVHRQKDPKFVAVLNAIREAKMTLADMDVINSRYIPNNPGNDEDDVVILKTKNRAVKSYNIEKLNELPGESVSFNPICFNQWHGKKPVDPAVLELKIGAKVMFLKNDTIDEQYRNGTIGYVESMSEDCIEVRIAKNNRLISVTKQTWDQFDFKLDKKEKRIITEVTAQFKQFPLKLAWAVTVHKSQGLTLDEVILDVADSFTFGQIYVALSRCTSLEGIRLEKMIPTHKIMVDQRVIDFKNCIAADGKVGILPSYKYDGRDACPDNTVVLPITIKRQAYIDELKAGKKNIYGRSISDIETAKQVFEYSDGSFVPNIYWQHIKRNWYYTDMNSGNCPLKTRDCKYVRIETKDGSHSSLFVLAEPIRIDKKNEQSEFWTCIVTIRNLSDFRHPQITTFSEEINLFDGLFDD